MADRLDVKVVDDQLVLGPVSVGFERTLRIPETGLHPLPPSVGSFPLRRVQDYPDRVPADWLAHGGVMLPIYQREAMWLSFTSSEPAALQVGIGKVCAVSGTTWQDRLARDPQNYVVLPEQPWLDGINAGDGFIRQFVAVPLGAGATVEGQLTGREVHGGVQLRAVGLTGQALRAWQARPRFEWREIDEDLFDILPAPCAPDMGLGAGGRMRQEVYADDRPLSDYDGDRSCRVFVHLCSATQWSAITGEVPPPTPVDRDAYVAAGLPWFDYYDADAEDLPAPEGLASVKSVGEWFGGDEKPFVPVDSVNVVTLKGAPGDIVTEGGW
ncbi:hypothetical protein A5740_00965 [Mycobacterium sp. GA-1841]|uniref:hypothetical protein n=1 Tax=Mycobacterium sp. GA-1841 TaxID=1834154 RepID=UPI00096EAE5D|nr:hypothetical protein [Mycobacterium sp. GA-1841]OMC34361.1 hypothetical protein A5740_00965 [Mycobacterium sp. GA-1841]